MDVLVVDGDGHTMEPTDLWVERMDAAKWGDWIPQARGELLFGEFWVGGELRSGGREALERICDHAGVTAEEYRAGLATLMLKGGGDPDARIVDLDRVGIDVAVLYPTRTMFFGPVDPIGALGNAEFVRDCQRAYNQWVAEYCGAAPDRLFAVGAVPLQDMELAVAEVERVAAMGLVGVMIRPSAYIDELPLSHEVYDRFWAACQDHDLAVGFHPGVHVDTPDVIRKLGLCRFDKNLQITNADVDPVYGGSGLGQAIGNTANMMVTMGRILMGGVAERFPRLRFLFLESGGGWCATQLDRMDEQVEAFALEGRWLSLLPSEYFARQCYISFEPGEWNLAASAEKLGADRVLWASDYPHPEYHDGVVTELQASVSSLSAEDQRRIVGENAIEAYRLPR